MVIVLSAMERSEPTFVPEWYKGTSSNANSSINSNHSSGSLNSDDHNSVFSSRSRIFASACDNPRSSVLSDRTSSFFRRSVSSNGSVGREKDLPPRAYSSFGKSNRDRDRDREKDLDLRDRDRQLSLDNGYSNYPDSLVSNTYEKDLKQSRSMVPARRADSWLKKPGLDSTNGALSSGSAITGMSKSSFERDFPSLGAEEKHVGSDQARVSSPALSAAIHNLPQRTSAIVGGDCWTSALAEVPPIAGGNCQVVSSALQTSIALTTSSISTGLNMAEALAQSPGGVQMLPQLTNDSQKIEELHRQQILKLRPVTPSILKNSGSNSADKSKIKGTRSAEFISSSKQQPSSHSKTSHIGQQFQVLNRERNGFSPIINNNSRAPSTIPPFKGQGSSFVMKTCGEKKITAASSQAQQNRNDFFNSLRKKMSCGQRPSADNDDSSSNLEKMNRLSQASAGFAAAENGNCSAGGSGFEEPEKLAPDEEEAAFLRSLGWEENAGEEALTREEIESFLSEYKMRKPASKLKP